MEQLEERFAVLFSPGIGHFYKSAIPSLIETILGKKEAGND